MRKLSYILHDERHMTSAGVFDIIKSDLGSRFYRFARKHFCDGIILFQSAQSRAACWICIGEYPADCNLFAFCVFNQFSLKL